MSTNISVSVGRNRSAPGQSIALPAGLEPATPSLQTRSNDGRGALRLDNDRGDDVSCPVVGPVLTASSTGWQVGIALGVVVIAVAAAIVITIVLLAIRISRQARTAEGAVEVVRQQTVELGGIAQINDSGVRILHAARALRKVAVGK